MGALTFKPVAYRTRPWETTALAVPNYFDGVGNLQFHYRGANLTRVTAAGWLRDRIRFGWDGFRRQRVDHPTVGGHPVGWSTLWAVWYTLVYHRNTRVVTDGFAPHVGWSTRVYRGLAHRGGLALTVAVDTPVWATVYHGAHGGPGWPVVIPGATPYENDGVGHPPVGATRWADWSVVTTQLLGDHPGATYGGAPLWWATTAVVKTVFQVSPLQRVLLG